jgi:UDP-N-acetylmuramate--alanine ligase
MHMPAPNDSGLFHIVGIGGIGMSAIAEVMHTRGYRVRGSDLKDSANLERLRGRGIPCMIGHGPNNIEGASYVVISSAVKPGNLEFEAAKGRGIPIIRRAEMLAELMRPCATVSVTGTHGKTTTTSLIAHLFTKAGLDPAVIAGGIINAWGTNARIGGGEWMVVEADESDGTFLKLPSQIGVVTNIDPEHMDYWPSLAALHQAYQHFIEAIPFYGALVACIDHPVVREMITKLGGANGRHMLTYGVARDADLRLIDLRADRGRIVFDVELGPGVKGGARKLTDLMLPVPGHYNALNALAALAVATEAGIRDDEIKKTFAGFSGVKRRFTHVGAWQGVQIYDDYAHHPVEIAAVLRAARVSGAPGRIIAVMQPHRYTRLQALFNEFAACLDDADVAIVTSIYSAGEAPIPGVDRDELALGLKRHGHPHVLTVDDEAELVETVASLAREGDLVVGLGAGTISEWINALPRGLAKRGAPA